MTRIAVLGWGSLIWDLDTLSDHVTGDWQMTAGPELPMEFSRISPKRKMGLVVCLDSNDGEACATHAIQSTRGDIQMAIADLAQRERAPLHMIGAVFADGLHKGRTPEICDLIATWCDANDWDGAVWTDLDPNFQSHTSQVYSIEAGIAYLQTLPPENLEEAYRYITNAPVHTDTPLRRALARDPWWQDLHTDADNLHDFKTNPL